VMKREKHVRDFAVAVRILRHHDLPC
jgi:hypothetical protein